jgi:hypothetical protein
MASNLTLDAGLVNLHSKREVRQGKKMSDNATQSGTWNESWDHEQLFAMNLFFGGGIPPSIRVQELHPRTQPQLQSRSEKSV